MPAQLTILHDQDGVRRRLLTETALEHAAGAEAALERLLAYAGKLKQLVHSGPDDATLTAARDQLRDLRRCAEALAVTVRVTTPSPCRPSYSTHFVAAGRRSWSRDNSAASVWASTFLSATCATTAGHAWATTPWRPGVRVSTAATTMITMTHYRSWPVATATAGATSINER